MLRYLNLCQLLSHYRIRTIAIRSFSFLSCCFVLFHVFVSMMTFEMTLILKGHFDSWLKQKFSQIIVRKERETAEKVGSSMQKKKPKKQLQKEQTKINKEKETQSKKCMMELIKMLHHAIPKEKLMTCFFPCQCKKVAVM